jgi:hypothetical protein
MDSSGRQPMLHPPYEAQRTWTRSCRALDSWKRAAVCSLLCLFSLWNDAQAGENVERLPATAVIRFAGTSTLHNFGGQLPAQPFFLVISNGTWSAASIVWAGQMNTGHEKRDGKMHQMFNTNAFPTIQGGVAGPAISGAMTNVNLRLQIRDKSHDLPVRITGWSENAREIRFHADWEVSLDAYGLNPPSVMGVIRVGNRVKLEADVSATRESPMPIARPSP